MTQVEITGELVQADRTTRNNGKKMSRQAYAELCGLTPTQINNIEHGRVIRPQEAEKLRPLIEEYLARTGGSVAPAAPGDDTAATVPEPGAATDLPDHSHLPPVVLLTEDEYEEAGISPLEEEVVTPGSGLVPKYDFQLEGYHVSNSELSTFRRCLRKWWFEYYRELRFATPQVTGARAIGTRLHLALAAYYSTRRDDPMQVLEETVKYDHDLLVIHGNDKGIDVSEQLTTLEKDADLCRAMLEGYLEWVQEEGVDQYLQVVGDEVVVEQPLAEVLGQKVILVGKLDLRLVRTLDNARLFLDHKSVGSLNPKMLHMDTQMLHYHLLEYLDMLGTGMGEEEAMQMRSTGGLYNMLRKVKRTKTANPPFFARIEVPHNPIELRSYHTRTIGQVEDMINLRSILDGGADPNQVAYPNPIANNCDWSCDFFLVCPMMDDGSRVEDMLASYYEKHNPHDHYLPYGDKSAGSDA